MSEDPTRILPNDATILQQILTEVRSLTARVQALEDKFDARSRETQPMSGRIDQLILDVAETRQELRAGLSGVRDELREHRLSTGREMRVIDKTMHIMIADLAEAIEGQDDLHKRVTKIEEHLEVAK